MGGTRLGETGGVGPPPAALPLPLPLLLPASSRSRREKSMEGGGSMTIGARRMTRSNALGCCDSMPISSGPRRSSGWWWCVGNYNGVRCSVMPLRERPGQRRCSAERHTRL